MPPEGSAPRTGPGGTTGVAGTGADGATAPTGPDGPDGPAGVDGRAGPALGIRPALDGVRGVAVVAVLVGHLGEFVVPSHEAWLLRGGFLGVDLFFVLSGFLITCLLLQERERRGSVRLGRFYGRRLVRLVPALTLFLVAHWVYVVVEGGDLAAERRTALLALLFLANWQVSFGYLPFAASPDRRMPLDLLHLWTLSVEGQFYLLWPPVLAVLQRLLGTVGRRLAALGALVALVAVVRAVELDAWGDPALVYQRTDARLDGLLVGAAAAVAWRAGWLARRGVAAAGVVGALVLGGCFALAATGSRWLFQGGFTVVALAAAALVVAALQPGSALERILSVRPLRVVGRASYSAYLWHLPIFIWTVRRWPEDPWARVAPALALTALAATASFVLVERPVMRRRGRG